MDTLHFAAPQIANSEASTQYQEYDRNRAEYELRMGIIPPLLGLAIVAPIRGRWWLICIALVVCSVLAMQAVTQLRASNEILATAIYVEQAKIPMIESVSDYIESLESKPTNDGEWMGAIIRALEQQGYYEATDDAVYELAHFNTEDRDAAAAYLEEHESEYAQILIRHIRNLDVWQGARGSESNSTEDQPNVGAEH
ncbi:hypothetical protein ABZ914_18310 [Spirillospora sp. NPDC046719]